MCSWTPQAPATVRCRILLVLVLVGLITFSWPDDRLHELDKRLAMSEARFLPTL